MSSMRSDIKSCGNDRALRFRGDNREVETFLYLCLVPDHEAGESLVARRLS